MSTRWFVAVTALILATSLAASALGRGGRPHAQPGECSSSQYPAKRDRSNPLLLPKPPGSDPLRGTHFFVDGPRHGAAASAIAKLLGMDPTTFSDSESWAHFDSVVVPRALKKHPALAHKVHMLEKIAREPEVQRFSLFTGGGGPGAILAQAQKIFCGNLTADPGSIPLFQTLFIYPNGQYCASRSTIAANWPTFKRQVNEMAQGTGRRPVAYLLELDAVATSSCLPHSALGVWEQQMRYEINTLSALPHTVVYVEGGYSDANRPKYTAKILNAIGVRRIRGFYTNDTHLNWTIDEVRWGQKISKMTHGAHFIVNTAQNGRGPKLNPHPVTQGIEDLCNPPGRGLGPQPTTHTGFEHVDAFLWTAVPGNSSGHCHGGPNSGVFWPARGVALAEHANGKLGPGYPSRPY